MIVYDLLCKVEEFGYDPGRQRIMTGKSGHARMRDIQALALPNSGDTIADFLGNECKVESVIHYIESNEIRKIVVNLGVDYTENLDERERWWINRGFEFEKVRPISNEERMAIITNRYKERIQALRTKGEQLADEAVAVGIELINTRMSAGFAWDEPLHKDLVDEAIRRALTEQE